MNALKTGLLQLNNEQLQRVLDTPRKKLLFNGRIIECSKYWPMVAGLPVADIVDIKYAGDKICMLKNKYGSGFNMDPSCGSQHYTEILQEVDYDGTIAIIKEILNERTENGLVATE